jgi:hypothetical protein
LLTSAAERGVEPCAVNLRAPSISTRPSNTKYAVLHMQLSMRSAA